MSNTNMRFFEIDNQINFIKYEEGLITFEIGDLHWPDKATSCAEIILPTGDISIVISTNWRIKGPKYISGFGKLECSQKDEFSKICESLTRLMNKKILFVEANAADDSIRIDLEGGFKFHSFHVNGISFWKLIDRKKFSANVYSYKHKSFEIFQDYGPAKSVAA